MPRIAIICAHGHDPFTPRGERTQELAAGFRERWDVEVIAYSGPGAQPGGAARRSSRLRGAARVVVTSTLLDRWEPWSRHRFRRWRPALDAAILIGYPFSPAVYASRRLADAGIPYIVDTGDPWVLTNDEFANTHLGLWRARRAERELLEGAAGLVVTTPQQAQPMRSLFPSLPILVRPNGYRAVSPVAPGFRRPRDDGRLRLAHFGMLSAARIDLAPVMQRLLADGPWGAVSFAQFGSDYAGMLDRLPSGVEVERHPSYPWAEVIERARDYDLALVLGNNKSGQLPSKAIQYLTLPIPRLSVTRRLDGDALADYVRGKPGWLAVSRDDSELVAKVAAHVSREWPDEDLLPPAEEAWPVVAEQVVDFVERHTLSEHGRADSAATPVVASMDASAP
jgi:Glycosyl transferase 4-like domain